MFYILDISCVAVSVCVVSGVCVTCYYLSVLKLFETYQQATIAFCVLLFRNSKEIENKYCLRGAEWGVGDCSAEGMTPEARDKFIAMLKEKVGEK